MPHHEFHISTDQLLRGGGGLVRITGIIDKSTSADTKLDWRDVENNIRDDIGDFLFQKTERRPMVLPIIMEV